MIKKKNIPIIEGFKKHLFLLLILSIVVSILEAASLSSIGGLVYTFLNDIDILKAKISSYTGIKFITNLGDSEFLNLIIIFIFLLFIVKNLIKLLNSYLEVSIIKRIQIKNSSALFKKYIDLDLLQFTNKKLNEILNDISAETIRASKFISSVVVFIREIILVFILIITLSLANFKVTFFSFLTIIVLLFLYNFVFRNKSKYFGNKITESQKLVLKNIIEPFQFFKFLKILDKKIFFEKKLLSTLREKIKFEIKQSMVLKYPPSYFEISFLVVLLVVSYFFFKSESDFNQALPFLSIFVLFSLRLANSFINIYNSINNLKFYKNSLKNVENKINSLNVIKKKKVMPIDFNEIELKNLSFRYPKSNNYIFKNLNIKIKKNKILGLFGPSGCGKSTLLDIILGLLKPTKGQILLNKKIFNFYKFHIYEFFSYIPQKSYLINDTIQNNINIGNDSNFLNKNKLRDSLKKSEIYKFVKSLPKGVKTICEDGGKNFSGGQAQRIALARALYINHKILIMDESTASLDKTTENKIFNNLRRDKSRTIIFVSHNKKLKKFCDHSIDFPAIKRISKKKTDEN